MPRTMTQKDAAVNYRPDLRRAATHRLRMCGYTPDTERRLSQLLAALYTFLAGRKIMPGEDVDQYEAGECLAKLNLASDAEISGVVARNSRP